MDFVSERPHVVDLNLKVRVEWICGRDLERVKSRGIANELGPLYIQCVRVFAQVFEDGDECVVGVWWHIISFTDRNLVRTV